MSPVQPCSPHASLHRVPTWLAWLPRAAGQPSTIGDSTVTNFQSCALIGIFLIVASTLAAARQIQGLRHEARQANNLLSFVLTTMRDRL